MADAKGYRLPRARCVVRAQEGSIRPWGMKIEQSALSDQRTPQSPPPAPLRRSPSPARFLRGFCFSQPGEVFFGTSTFHIDFTKAGGPLPKASVGPALETYLHVGAKCPDSGELRSRSLLRSGSFSSTAPPAGDHVALVQVGLTEQPRKTAPISYRLPLESKNKTAPIDHAGAVMRRLCWVGHWLS
jgi:hypothetical protein